jgi:radical SAM superfamily enzyme YgiQ (UPF0313 family)
MTRKAILINPPSAGSYRTKIMIGDSLSLSSVAQVMILNGWEVEIFDLFLRQWDTAKLLENIGLGFDFIGITVMHIGAMEKIKEIIAGINAFNPTAYIAIGGSAATLDPEKFTVLDVNCIFSGDDLTKINILLEDAEVFYKLKKPSRDAKIFKANQEGMIDYDYPLIHRPDIGLSFDTDKIISIEGSRGCYGKCGFCSIKYEYNSHWLPRINESIFKEIDYIKSLAPECSHLRFIDANFLGGGDAGVGRTLELTNYLKSKGLKFRIECRINDIKEGLFQNLKENGLAGVFTGIENGDQHILDKLCKNTSSKQILEAVNLLKKLRVSYSFGFMMVTPYTNKDIVRENIRFLKEVEYGIRWKHFFSGLIILKDNIYQVGAPLETYEAKLGYRLQEALCAKILHFNEICLKEFLEVMELEHAAGISIERGKESGEPKFWVLDKEFSGTCIDLFERLITNFDKISNDHREMYQLAERYMGVFKAYLLKTLGRIKDIGLSESVMLNILKPYIG